MRDSLATSQRELIETLESKIDNLESTLSECRGGDERRKLADKYKLLLDRTQRLYNSIIEDPDFNWDWTTWVLPPRSIITSKRRHYDDPFYEKRISLFRDLALTDELEIEKTHFISIIKFYLYSPTTRAEERSRRYKEARYIYEAFRNMYQNKSPLECNAFNALTGEMILFEQDELGEPLRKEGKIIPDKEGYSKSLVEEVKAAYKKVIEVDELKGLYYSVAANNLAGLIIRSNQLENEELTEEEIKDAEKYARSAVESTKGEDYASKDTLTEVLYYKAMLIEDRSTKVFVLKEAMNYQLEAHKMAKNEGDSGSLRAIERRLIDKIVKELVSELKKNDREYEIDLCLQQVNALSFINDDSESKIFEMLK